MYSGPVNRLKRYLDSITITPFGIVILLLFAVSLGTFALGPADAQAPALVTAVVLAVFLAGANMAPMGMLGSQRTKTLDERRAEFRPQQQLDSASSLDSQDDAELWRKERERYRQSGRSV